LRPRWRARPERRSCAIAGSTTHHPALFTTVVSDCGADGIGLILVDEAQGADAGWQVIALDDEIGNPLVPETEPALPGAEPALSTLAASLTPALRAPVEGLLQARADDQRAAALEQLRYAMPPLAVVSDLMPLLLADGAELVRERTIGLMVAAGAHVAVIDLVRALQRRDDGGLARAGEAIPSLNASQRDLAISALAASAQRGYITPRGGGPVRTPGRAPGRLSRPRTPAGDAAGDSRQRAVAGARAAGA
jgi:hypothetical protein